MMEEYVCQRKECPKKDKKRCCVDIVIFILTIALVATIDLIFGAVFAEAILGALAAIIVLAVVLAILIVIRIIMLICNNRRY